MYFRIKEVIALVFNMKKDTFLQTFTYYAAFKYILSYYTWQPQQM